MGVGGLAHLTRGWLILFGWSLRSPHLSPTLPLFLYTVFFFYFIVFILQQHSAPSKKPAHSSPSLPLCRRNGNAAVIVVIASRLFTNEILNGRTVFWCPTQFGRLQNNASFFQAAVTVWLEKKNKIRELIMRSLRDGSVRRASLGIVTISNTCRERSVVVTCCCCDRPDREGRKWQRPANSQSSQR